MARRTSSVTVTQREAAHILGCSLTRLRRLIQTGQLHAGTPRLHRQLDRDQVEQLAARLWKTPPRGTPADPRSYWVSTRQAADILGVGRNRVGQLVDRGFLPCVRSPHGVRLFRRTQVEVIANARLSRRLQRPSGKDKDTDPAKPLSPPAEPEVIGAASRPIQSV